MSLPDQLLMALTVQGISDLCTPTMGCCCTTVFANKVSPDVASRPGMLARETLSFGMTGPIRASMPAMDASFTLRNQGHVLLKLSYTRKVSFTSEYLSYRASSQPDTKDMGLHRINGPAGSPPSKRTGLSRLPQISGNAGAAPQAEPSGLAQSSFEIEEVASSSSREQEQTSGRRTRKPKLDELPHEEQVDRAKTTILNILSMVTKTQSQLEKRLSEKGYSDIVIEEAIDRMIEVGVIDDASFARTYASSRHQGRGLARRAISRELHQKGIDQEMIDEALESVDDDAERERAVELVRKQARTTAHLETQVRVRRLVGMLARKGYPGSVAFGVVKEVLAEEDASVNDINPED